MRRALLIAAALGAAACGGGSGAPAPASPSPDPAPAPADDEPAVVESSDPRVLHLRAMTELLSILTDDVEVITGDAGPSAARCDQLADAVTAWGGAHYQAYETADAEGSFLGLTAADADDPAIRVLARELALVSTQLIDLVDEDCLYGSGAYGDALYEYLIGFQGLAHWSRDGQPAIWDYETLIAEASAS